MVIVMEGNEVGVGAPTYDNRGNFFNNGNDGRPPDSSASVVSTSNNNAIVAGAGGPNANNSATSNDAVKPIDKNGFGVGFCEKEQTMVNQTERRRRKSSC